MLKKNIIFTVCIILFSIRGILYAEDITLEQALSDLYSTHEGISQADLDYRQKELERKAALGLYSPRFSINALYTYFGKDLTMDVDLDPLKQGLSGILSNLPIPLPIPPDVIVNKIPDTVEQVVQKEQFFSLNAAMIWPVFTGGQIIAANQAAKANLAISKSERFAKRNELGSSLAEKYFTLRFAQDVVALKEDVRNSMQQHYERAIKLEKVGMLAKVERLHAEMSLKEAEKSLNQSKREIKLANSAFKSMINSQDEEIRLSTPLFIIEEGIIEPLNYFQDLASLQNPRLKQLQSAQGLAKAGVTNARSEFIPKINAFGMVNIYDYQLSSVSPDAVVGVQMKINLFDGLHGYHKYKASKSAEESVKLRLVRAEKDIKTLVEQQYISLENARADYVAAQSSLAFTEEYLRARKKAFSQGIATSLDVVDAELALSNAKLEAITAAYKFDIALIKLLETAGIFDAFNSYRVKATIEPVL